MGSARLACIILAVGAAACSSEEPPPQLANPASEHCVQHGGKHVAEKRPDGAAFGVCQFEDNRQCEEWALLRGQCPAGGIRVTGYVTPAARYCAITGGAYVVMKSDTGGEIATCTRPGGTACDADAFYRGTCDGSGGRGSTTPPASSPASWLDRQLVNWTFAGTLSPTVMTSRLNGSSGMVELMSDGIDVEFSRYQETDPLCCPSSRVRVRYRIERSPNTRHRADDGQAVAPRQALLVAPLLLVRAN
jgi:putative hemolysin